MKIPVVHVEGLLRVKALIGNRGLEFTSYFDADFLQRAVTRLCRFADFKLSGAFDSRHVSLQKQWWAAQAQLHQVQKLDGLELKWIRTVNV